MPDGRVLIATAAGPLVAAPTWTRFDDMAQCRCAGFDITRGRQSEFDVTDTGRARVYFRDRNQTTNDVDLVGKQIVLQAFDPVANTWIPQFRGLIDNITFDVAPSGVKSDVQFDCTDIFEYLAGVRILVDGTFGNAAPAGAAGSAFYEDGRVDTRITKLLTDAQLVSSMYVVFTGNVNVNETLYDSSDNILSALRDAADAEFPGIANVYVDKRGGTDGTGGRVAFHGRFARFTPDSVAAGAGTAAWDFTRWTAATMEDVSTTAAQIRAFSFSYPRARIINSYIAWPRADELGFPFRQSLIETLERSDATSITAYGYRGRSAPDLIIKDNFNNNNSGAVECGLFGDFYVANYAVPRKNIETITFKSLHPDDPRAEKTWAAMLGMDISDIIALTIDEAGIAAEDYYVEGLNTSVRYLNPEYDMVEVTPNLSPAAFWDYAFPT
jgi:hypothetical protein